MSLCILPQSRIKSWRLNDLKILPPVSLEENITNEEGWQIMSQLDSFSTTQSSKSTEGSLIVFQESCKIESQSQESKISRKVTCSEKIPEFVKLLKNNIFFWKNIQNKLNCNIAALRKLVCKPHLVMGRLQLYILTGLKMFILGKHERKKVLISLKIKFHYMQCDYMNMMAKDHLYWWLMMHSMELLL